MGARDALTKFPVNDGETTTPFSIDWDRIKQLVDSTGRETYTFGLSVDDGNPATFYNLVLRYNEFKEAHQPFILKYTMDEDFLPQFIATGNLKGFKGSVRKILINENAAIGGRRGNAALGGGDISLGDPCPNDTPIGPGGGGGGGSPAPGGGGSWGCTTYMIETTWYSQVCDASGCGDPVVIGRDYSFETECGWTNESNADLNGNCQPEIGEIPIIEPKDLDHLIMFDPSFLNTKAECIYNKLGSTSSSFADLIRKFDGDFPVSHLKFMIDNTLPSDIGARTSPPRDYVIDISINGQTMDSKTNPEIARNLVHEVIHAEIYRKVLSVMGNGGSLYGMTRQEWHNKLSQGDYPGIFDFYSRYGLGKFQHEQMASYYVSVIASMLKQFDKGQHSDQLYKDLAWGGLTKTTA